MADGCLLLVDAVEGPMPQTRFVLAQGARARPRARSSSSTRSTARTRASSEVLELDAATSSSSWRPTPTSSTSRCSTPSRGTAAPGRARTTSTDDLRPLFEAILEHVPRARRRPGRRRSRCWSPRSTTTTTGAGSPSAASRRGSIAPGQTGRARLDRDGTIDAGRASAYVVDLRRPAARRGRARRRRATSSR